MKKILSVIFVSFLFSTIFAQSYRNSNIDRFIKGNIQEKTISVREASESDAVWLCDKAVSFVLDSREILGEDRELDGLAVAAILSYPQSYVRASSETLREKVIDDFIRVFEAFSYSPNVQITVISKLNSLSRELKLNPFIKNLNTMLVEKDLMEADHSVVKSVINFLSLHGDSDSFLNIYNVWHSSKYSIYNSELENAVVSLLPVSMNEAVKVVETSGFDETLNLFNVLNRNRNRINANSFCVLSENILSKTILYVRKSQDLIGAAKDVQIACVQVLGQYKWTRASRVVLDYFDFAKGKYSEGVISEDDFIKVIVALGETSPLDAVPALIEYLEVLNLRVEKYEPVSETVALGVINTLGAIGDKSSFDSLLGVTYYDYPQSVLAAAREALSALRW